MQYRLKLWHWFMYFLSDHWFILYHQFSLNKREQSRIKLVSFEDESTPTEKIETKPLKFERKPILTNFPSVLLLNKSQNFKIINGVDIFNDWKE